MKPLLSLSNTSKLEETKSIIKSLLIARCNEKTTLHQLSLCYKEEIGDEIPYQDFNYASLKQFLTSIPDTVNFYHDEKNKLCVCHVESDKTKHLSSLIARQVPRKQSRKLASKPKLHFSYIDPLLLRKVFLKLSTSSNIKGRFKKVDVLSEIKAIMTADDCAHFFYTIQDLNNQLSGWIHILTHDDEYIQLKNPNGFSLQELVKKSTIDRLQKLIEKHEDGIWCTRLPDVYRKEYGLDLEYNHLGFISIDEFIMVLPDIFKVIKPLNTYQYKVVDARRPLDDSYLGPNLVVENVNEKSPVIKDALPRKSLTKKFIPQEFMNLDDSIRPINIQDIFAKLGNTATVVVSEICNPSLFWIILAIKKHRLITLMQNLQEFYSEQDLSKYEIPPIVLKPGLHIACQYSKRWHRGIIRKIESDTKYQIEFYDYGTKKVYAANELYYLHKQFASLPAQAIPCSMYNVSPVKNNEWSKETIEKFVARAIEKKFIACVHNVNQQSLTVDLINTTSKSERYTYLTKWMVSNHLALWKNQVKPAESLGNIFDEDFVINSDCVKPAKQLEALRNYKTKFKKDSSECKLEDDENKVNNLSNVNLEVTEVTSNTTCLDTGGESSQLTNDVSFSTESRNSERQNATSDAINNNQSRVGRPVQQNIGKALIELQKLMKSTKFLS